MYKYHPHFFDIPDETKIWKYLDLFKYLDIIKSKTLFLSRADLFKDRYEGRGHDRETIAKKLRDDLQFEIPRFLPETIADVNEYIRENSYVNCWHINDFESSVMWDAYSNPNGGLAIQSTVGSLKASIIDPADVYVSQVKYSRNDIPLANAMYPLLFKREEFNDERELRVFISNITDLSPTGLKSKNLNIPKFTKISIDSTLLIEQVFFHPLTPQWVANSICGILEHFEEKFIPKISKLYEEMTLPYN